MRLEEFRRRHRTRAVRAGGQHWGVIEAKGRRGAPVLVMLPGTLGTAEIFWNQIAALKGRVRVVSLTYPAVGDIFKLADGLAARVQTLYIGNSLTDPKTVNPANQPVAVLKRAPAKAHQAIVLGSIEAWAEPAPVYRRLKEILRHSGRKLIPREALKRRVLATATGKAVPKLALPPARTVIIECADDPLIPRAAQKAMRRQYPRAKLYRFARGGHYPYITRAADYTKILARHLPRAPTP